jgi:hypothetical protein
MVKFFLLFLLFLQLLNGQEIDYDENVSKEDPLQEKIKSFVSPVVYEQNRGFIEVIFEPKSAYYRNERVDALKVAQTLKENGLLNLFFQEPKTFTLHFKTSGSPVFFVKIMGDTLRSMGYFRYMTTDSTLDASEFVWSIALRSEYATDPLILQKQLQKSGASIVDIERKNALEWSYSIDISQARLHVVKLFPAEELKLRHSLYAQWLDVSEIKRLKIKSSSRNRWYPYIAFYDGSLHLIKLVKKERVTYETVVEMPKNAHYMKLSDLYTLKNVRDSLTLYPSEER